MLSLLKEDQTTFFPSLANKSRQKFFARIRQWADDKTIRTYFLLSAVCANVYLLVVFANIAKMRCKRKTENGRAVASHIFYSKPQTQMDAHCTQMIMTTIIMITQSFHLHRSTVQSTVHKINLSTDCGSGCIGCGTSTFFAVDFSLQTKQIVFSLSDLDARNGMLAVVRHLSHRPPPHLHFSYSSSIEPIAVSFFFSVIAFSLTF